MQCETIKEGLDCTFMTKKGCSFNGGACHAIVEQCNGCDRVAVYPEGTFCSVFPDPSIKWRRGTCNMATHIKTDAKGQEGKVRVGQQKQKKKK